MPTSRRPCALSFREKGGERKQAASFAKWNNKAEGEGRWQAGARKHFPLF